MKNLISASFLICFLLLSKTGIAQNGLSLSNYNKVDSIAVDSLVNLIVKSTGKDFKFDRRHFRRNIVGYFYANPDLNSDPLIISFSIYMEGENKDLGMIGSPIFSFNAIHGRFLDLYPLWKKYFSDKLTPVELTKTGEIVKTSDKSEKVRFRRSYDLVWSIDIL